MFGHVISLNFKSKGETYPTCIGGLFSLLIEIGMLFYVGYHLKTMLYMENNALNTQGSYLDLTNKTITMNNTDITLFYALYNLKDGIQNLEMNDELGRYLKFQYT